ncbi:MAG: phospholipase D-like domain-containing protein [Bacteroidota bacterium]
MPHDQFLIHNTDSQTVADTLRKLARSADEVRLAVAYFSDNELVDEWLQQRLKMALLVALQPPTNPEILKRLLPLPLSKIEVKFFHSNFHSKLYLFYKESKPFAALVGSSNFTGGGLASNLETNVYLTASEHISPLETQFNEMWAIAASLSPQDVNTYRAFYNKTKAARDNLSAKHRNFESRYLSPRLNGQRSKPIKEAINYFTFWKCVDEVIDAVRSVSAKEWPTVRPYLTVDHFWHWVVKVWDRSDLKRIQSDAAFRKSALPNLFKRYSEWDKTNTYHTMDMKHTAKRLYDILKPGRIHRLTKGQAMEIYASLHSGGMRTQRFRADRKFAQENSLDKLRDSLNYLLWSSDDIAVRITAILVNPKYKLKHFGSSNAQELLGWVHSELPLRNDKADNAVELLGYEFR